MEARDVEGIFHEREPGAHVDVEGKLLEAHEHDVHPSVRRGVVPDRPAPFRVESLGTYTREPGFRLVRDPHDVKAVSVP